MRCALVPHLNSSYNLEQKDKFIGSDQNYGLTSLSPEALN